MKTKKNEIGLTMQEAIEQNKLRGQAKRIEQAKRQKRENIKEIILASIIGTFIIIVVSVLIGFMNKPTADAIENCLASGKSEYTCLKGLVN